MSTDWYDRAVEELEQELAEGDISQEEFDDNIRSLNQDLEEEAQRAYDDVMHRY